jgi:hypothetical protein
MKKILEITLNGTEDQLAALFSYTNEIKDSNLSKLETHIAHTFNQILVRDGFYGAWAMVYKDNGTHRLKIFSPHHDLEPYEQLIQAYMKAGSLAVSIFQENQQKINTNEMRFTLPFGLAMMRAKSIQLLHFPPLEAFVYQDYLYSPTNRRWENLLAYNHLNNVHFAELESIVDCVPLAAPGGDSKGIEPFNNVFTPYVKEMLKARLNQDGPATQPVIAYGSPVKDWLEQNFADQITQKLETLSLIELQLVDRDVKTPVLCANHPSKYLYFTGDHDPSHLDEKKEILTQDLIAAGWQARMAYHPEDSPQQVLEEMKARWTGNKRVLEIMKEEDESFGYIF